MAWRILKDNIVDVIYTGVNKIQPAEYTPDEAIATSYLGTPVYSNLVINNGQWIDPVYGQTVKYNGLRVDSAIIQVSGEKNIVMTEIQGRNGTIKELINNRDYQIQIAGYLISHQINVAPIEEKNVLIKIFQAQSPVEVVSQFLNDFGIYNMVIQACQISEEQGHRSRIPFTLTCISDIPYDLEIVQEQEQQ